METFRALRCPADGQRLFDATLRGAGTVRHKCPRCGGVWSYDLKRQRFTLEPASAVSDTCQSEHSLQLVPA